jgi:hypothetical protein
MNYESFDAIFILSASSIAAGLIAASIRMCYRSKCRNVSCCYGLFTIRRDTEGETEVDLEIAHHHTDNDEESSKPNLF